MSENNGTLKKVIIIGSGPAGLTAGLYAARANLNPLVLEGTQPGGQLTITTDVENYPGFPDGILGPELMDKMRHQASRFGAECKYETVSEVDFSERPFKIKTEKGDYTGDSVIISTGASALFLGVPGEEEYMGRGVSACATCDGFFFSDQEIVVVGGGDTAMEEATYLTKFAKKVHVVHRRDELRASKTMQDRAKKNEKIEFIWDTVIDEIVGDENAVNGVKLRNIKTGEESDFPVEGVFMAIGHTPNTGIFKGKLDMDDIGYLKLKNGSTQTNIEGVFAAGDVADHVYRQAVTAAGTGCMAAMDAERWLEEQES
ncbi:MAG: thioredoxin-disulfide reductase [Candidatus Marinimicrobia bacterium]|nr:thioredoxin-disulfide reductase [Candidatus Neomarinimicrobiota bacterium]